MQNPGGTPSDARTVLFQRKAEPRENAFTLLVPQGWLIEGGIVRENLMQARVSAQNIAAKIDVAVKRDAAGTVMVRGCPEYKYADPRWTVTGQMGWMQPGSLYNGMIVWQLLDPPSFLVQVMFPWAHPQAQNAQLLEQKPLPELQERWQRQAVQGLGITYAAGEVTYTYSEGGVQYKERAQTVIENFGQMGAGMWSNKDSIYWRAPVGELEQWEPVLHTIRRSTQMNPQWVQQEMQSQGILTQSYNQAQAAERERARRALETQRYVQDTLNQIADHRNETQAEIRNDQYLNMTSQEEYVNPYTGKVDTASNQWSHRWVNDRGDEFYTDYESTDPNSIQALRYAEWKRTPVRPRGPADS